MADKIIRGCEGSIKGKTIAILGITFKPNTDDIRDAPSLEIIPTLQKEGANIKAYDPEGMIEGKHVLTDVNWCENAYEAMEGAHAVAILTEWNEFRGLDVKRMKALLREPTIIDLRNIYDPAKMQEIGFNYTSIGRHSSN